MTTPEFSVDLLITPSHSFFDGSGVVAGLSQLHRAGAICLRTRAGDVFDSGHGRMVSLVIHNPEGHRRSVVIDLADRADHFSMPFLRQSDVYYKRSYSQEYVSKLPGEYQPRIKPYGLNLACLGKDAMGTYVRVAAGLLANRLRSSGTPRVGPAIAEFLRNCRIARGLPAPSAFERRNGSSGQGSVILQTRVWPPEPSADDLGEVNSQRVALVAALRAGIGDRFSGGIVVDSFSRATCPPEVLVYDNIRRAAYIGLVRSAAIGVYVRGLHHAIGIKMAEYLAGGLCIVSEPLQYELPVPLIVGLNYLVFDTHEDCVAKCLWLLKHPSETARMRAANVEYYRKWVAPRALVADLLQRSFK
jgi:hypothetical protein